MKKALRLIASGLVLFIFSAALTSCDPATVENPVSSSKEVIIDGETVNTVEARMGAFSCKRGSVIEFRFKEPSVINTVYLMEKTTVIEQYNIYAEIDGTFRLIFTGDRVVDANLIFPTVTATALKLEILKITIGENDAIMQSVNAYYIPEYESEVAENANTVQ